AVRGMRVAPAALARADRVEEALQGAAVRRVHRREEADRVRIESIGPVLFLHAADLRAEKVDLVVREAGGELLPVVVQRRPSEDDATAGEVAQFPRHWIGLALPQDRVEEEARLAQTDAQRIDA